MTVGSIVEFLINWLSVHYTVPTFFIHYRGGATGPADQVLAGPPLACLAAIFFN